MTADTPFFTIIVPTYNRAHLIGNTINSVLRQDFNSFEIIVVDDGGNDNTRDIIGKLNDERIKYYWKCNGERGAARNFGWQLSNGQYVTFLDSDDILYPFHLSNAFSKLEKFNHPKCYAQAYEIKDAANCVLRSGIMNHVPLINNEILKGNFLSCFGVFLKREIIADVMFEEDRRFAGTEDWLLWLKLSALYPFYYDNAVTGALIEHNGRSVLSFPEENLLFRTNFIRDELVNNPAFIKSFGIEKVNTIYAHMLSYTSLHLALSGKKGKALYYLKKSISINFVEFFSRRTLAIIKRVIF